MKVDELMTRKLITIEPDDSLATVMHIFSNTGFHHLLVVEHDRLVGVVSDRDLLKAVSPNLGTPSETSRDTATLNKHVHQIMSRRLECAQTGDDLTAAITLLADKPISCVPIVDQQARAIGIITWRDILRHVRDQSIPQNAP